MHQPRILFLDIEASNLSASVGYTLAIGYKWAHEKQAKVLSLGTHPGKKSTDDRELLKAFEPIFNEADIVVHHFGQYYDIPFLQTRRLIHGMKPMPVIQQVDTWRIAKKRLKFHSNRLDAILKALKCPYEKTSVDFNKWIDASAGDRKALAYIVHHCKMDVLVLEWVYNHIRAVWDQHPRINSNLEQCPNGCVAKSRSNGRLYCTTRIYQRRLCCKCGRTWKGSILKNDRGGN